MMNKILLSKPVQKLAARIEYLGEFKRLRKPVTYKNKEGLNYIVYEPTLFSKYLWHTFYLRRWLKADHILLKLYDKPGGLKVMLEYKLSDLWIGIFWRIDPIYDVSSQEALRNFCEKKFNLVPVSNVKVQIWICLIPCLPVHLLYFRRLKNG